MIAARVRRATWVALPCLGALASIAPTPARALVAALIGTIGIAHGANDDRILARLAPRFPGGRTAISVAYAALALGVFIAARSVPRTAERALGLLAWYHFGSGDVALARACGPVAHPLETLVRGGVPLRIGASRRHSRVALAFALGYASSQLLRGRAADALDVAIPATTLAFAPASLGFAAYFGAWHAPRHLALVLERDPAGGSAVRRLIRFARESARNTLLAAGGGAVALAVFRGRAEPHAIATALTLGITVPHQCVVWYAERAARPSP